MELIKKYNELYANDKLVERRSKRIGEYWSLDIGSAVTNGASSYINNGAGFQRSFNKNSNDEVIWNFVDLDGYDGSDLTIVIGGELYNKTPSSNDNIVIEIDYLFIFGDGSEDGYNDIDGTIRKVIDVSHIQPNSVIPFNIGNLTGKADAQGLFITLRRKGKNSQDTYKSSWDIYGGQLIKN